MHGIWVLTYTGFIGAVSDEEIAQLLAVMRPDNIYFFAELAT